MRVAWVVYGALDQPTGGYVYDRLVVEGLRACGDEVRLVDPAAAPAAPRGVDVVVGDGLCVRELGPMFEAMAPGPVRVLLVHHMPSWELERRGADALRALEARAAAASDRLVATGEVTAARLVREYPGTAVDTVVPGADRLRRHPREPGRPAGVPRLLFIGSLIPRKRIPMLLDAVEALEEGTCSLELVGDGSRDPEHAALVARRIESSPRLRTRVTVRGVMSEEALGRALARADALVLPSTLEGYGMVLTEALHAGVPALCAREAATAASLDSHAAVRVFDDADGLGLALKALTHDPPLLGRMHAAAEAATLPRWADTVSSLRASLTRAIGAAAARPPGRERSP